MSMDAIEIAAQLRFTRELTNAEREEMTALGILSSSGDVLPAPLPNTQGIDKRPVLASPEMR